MKSVKVFAPATVANVGCGFDAMGFAFKGAGDLIEMSLTESDDIEYVNESGVNLPTDPEKNLMTHAIRAMWESTGKKCGVKIVIKEKISPGSGIGSSASAAASAVVGYNELMELGFSDEELIPFALEGECIASGARHADNVAPALLGGVVLVRDYNPIDVVRIHPAMKLYCAVVHPHIEVKTIDSRAVLKPELPMSTAIRQWANLGSFIAGLYNGDVALVSRALKDYVAEPYRKKFIPEYDKLKSAISECEGAIGSNISGSGPSVFALATSQESADNIAKVMAAHFEELGVGADTYSSDICNEGCHLINA
ncbi:MAG: homoserine kinase [Rikenellaceae bacterium]